MNRAEVAQIFSRERNHSGEWYSGNSLGKKGKIVRKLFWEECYSNLFITACWLGELTDKFRINTKFEDWYLSIVSPSSIQGDQSKLGCPEESLFERSSGFGREETASHCYCCPKLKQVLSPNCFYFSNYEWLDVMLVVIKWFTDESVLVYQS